MNKLRATLWVSMMIMGFSAGAKDLKSFNKIEVQKSMKAYVNASVGEMGHMPVLYNGEVLKLNLLKTKKYPDGFHAGVKNNKHLFTSCADFKDKQGNTYDVDFLVAKVRNEYKVIQPIIHSVNGKKNPYDLKH